MRRSRRLHWALAAPLLYVQRTQEAVAAIAPPPDAAGAKKRESWLGAVGDRFLDGLMVYCYPVLGLTLLLGAIAVAASVAGDMAGYRLGQALGGRFLQRWGRWIGYTAARRVQVERQFERHGMLTVILSRTLASYLSSVVNLLAGAGRYRFARFLALALVGRLLWSAAYLGLGYFGSNGDLDAATRLLQNLSAMLISLALLAVSIRLTFRSAPADTGNAV
jgi:membrane protein DedA with SNARE-associated domain